MNYIDVQNGAPCAAQQDTPAVQSGEVLVKVSKLVLSQRSLRRAANGQAPAFGFFGHVVKASGELKEGEGVTALPYLACGKCPACLEGHPNACEKLQVFGRDLPGFAGKYVAVTEAAVIPARSEKAASALLYAEAEEAVRCSGLRFNQRVAVSGSDAFARLLGTLSLRAGAASVVFFVSSEAEAASITAAGFDAQVSATADEAKAAAAAITEKKFFDVVFETVGTEISALVMLAVAKRGSTFVILSAPEQAPVFHIATAIRNQVAFRGCQFATELTFRRVLRNLDAADAAVAACTEQSTDLASAAAALAAGKDVTVSL